MAHDDTLDRLLQAWRDDIDSEPCPVISEVALPRQTRRRLPRGDAGHAGQQHRNGTRRTGKTSTSP
ncbi:hypothetical protein SAMN05421630_102626 [Prauserella marina]|uniref:Uncharacterized protein n=1 Tax=Prauserella marina TaxID=530584 RepID=A0A1G6MPM4_9PSEU|nr:hypothetical protein DES30_1011365 [Prauserella marina]SDC57184.1 hypothetical protein SAMN05421630_102626 [Prauserella marina]